MAFKRIVANSEEDLETIMNKIMNWFDTTNQYESKKSTEKRRIQDPDTKKISEKDIDVLKVTDISNDKFSTIKFIPMIKKNEMKIEIGGEGEAAVTGKISNQIGTRGKLKSYSKDKKVALKEALDKRLGLVFLKYKGQSFPMDYKTGSKFERFVKDLEKSGYFSDDDEVSDFMKSDDFYNYANPFGVEIKYPIDNDMLSVAPEKPSNPSDSIPRQARDMSARPGATPGATSYTDDDLQELLKKGKVKKSVLREIIKREYKK